jgi:hypothetical protein
MIVVYKHRGLEDIIACTRCKLTYSFTKEEIKTFDSEPGSVYGYVDYYIDCPKCGTSLEVDRSCVK